MSSLNPVLGQKANYDLAVCYRIYPRVSGQPIFGFKEKLPLVRINLESFRAAIGNLKVKMWVILDNCPPAYQALVEATFPQTDFEFICLNGAGNQATFAKQVEILTRQNVADLVYFAEDDYLYLPNSLEYAVGFMRRHKDADFVTLYDHADYYTKYVHRIAGPAFLEDNRRWHTVASTCLTFLARKQALLATEKTFLTYGRNNSDLGLWLALTKVGVLNPWAIIRSLGDGLFFAASQLLAWRHAPRQVLAGKRRSLWVASPSLATHMELSGLAPGVDWHTIFKLDAAN